MPSWEYWEQMAARYGLAHDTTGAVESWTWKTYNVFPMKMDLVFGIIDNHNHQSLVGSALFWDYNSCNVELNFYGIGLTLGIAKGLALVAAKHFNVTRCTIREPDHKTLLINRLEKFGFEVEGTEKHFYGWNKHCVRLVMFRPQIDRLANLPEITPVTIQEPVSETIH